MLSSNNHRICLRPYFVHFKMIMTQKLTDFSIIVETFFVFYLIGQLISEYIDFKIDPTITTCMFK